MAVKTYNRKTYYKKAINSKFTYGEHACKDGYSNILLDIALYAKILLLFTRIPKTFRQFSKITKIVVNSGHRTPSYDKKVGGNGKGFHTKGQAADIVVHCPGGIVPAKYVCCVAQDLGFKGIGYISNKNTATHLDIGNRKWWGDETKNNKSVGSSFYSYFGIKKNPPVAKGTRYVVTGNRVRVRSSTSTKNTKNVTGYKNKGNVVTVYSISGNWARITSSGSARYIHKSYLKKA